MTASKEKTEGSVYSPLMEGEIQRLSIQAKLTREADMGPITRLKELFKSKKHVYVLDVGCGYGVVARDRFFDWENITVIGVDFQEGALEMAREVNKDADNYVFEQANLESADFEQRIREIMHKYNVDGFDLIFGAYIVQHLENPILFLERCRKLLKDDGYILLRNTADKSTISYGDGGLIKEIQDRSERAPGNASRDLGLQLHHHLYVAGYSDIKIYGWMKDLSGLTENQRMDIFKERFSWRSMYFKRASEQNPEDEWLKKEYQWMTDALNRLQNIFKEPSFWYGETIINALAKK